MVTMEEATGVCTVDEPGTEAEKAGQHAPAKVARKARRDEAGVSPREAASRLIDEIMSKEG
jgi:hypothetical protein